MNPAFVCEKVSYTNEKWYEYNLEILDTKYSVIKMHSVLRGMWVKWVITKYLSAILYFWICEKYEYSFAGSLLGTNKSVTNMQDVMWGLANLRLDL